jgi:hypothetical protein
MTENSEFAEQRAQAHEAYVANYLRDHWTISNGYVRPVWTLCREADLAYFDKHEPAVADAIRYGVRPGYFHIDICGAELGNECDCGAATETFAINYPREK